MAKNKLKKFAEYETFNNTFDARAQLKGRWHSEVFRNNNPITLELACGRGEYTVGLAGLYPDRNFIGIDVKASRMWQGAKYATEQHLDNVAFLRIQIDFLADFFEAGEISEIWITFPDPQPQKPRAKQRLTHPKFLSIYKTLLQGGGSVNLKTDSDLLYQYTQDTTKELGLHILKNISDIYASEPSPELQIQTYYEKLWREQGLKIKYLQFLP